MRKEHLFKPGKAVVDRAFNVEASVDHIHRGYEFTAAKESRITETGHLKVFELKSEYENFPLFVGRWDAGKEVIDVDIENVSRAVKKSFKKGRPNYRGHHTELINKERRTFRIDIEIEEICYLKADLFFNINHNLVLADKMNLTAQILPKLIPGRGGFWMRN